MNCQEFLEFISAVSDDKLAEETKPQVAQHLENCIKCRTEVELEQLTKSFINRTIKPVRTPKSLRKQILTRLSSEAKYDNPKRFLLQTIFSKPSWKIAIALGSSAALVLLILFLTPFTQQRHSHASPLDANIIHQIYNNFDSVLAGKIEPQVSSGDPQILKAFFETKENFHVQIPPMKRCKLIGAFFNKYAHEGVAHLVYQQGENIIYLYEVKLQDVLDTDALQLPQDILDKLFRTGWYFENHLPDCSLSMWLTDSTVCCAISDIKKEKLQTYLTERE